VGIIGHPLPAGRRLLTLESTSMEPGLRPGSLLLIQKELSYQPGDVVSLWERVNGKDELVTHRIMGIGGNVYITKGDSNQLYDRGSTPERLIEGRVVMSVPVLGGLVMFLQSKVGLAMLMILIAIILSKEFIGIYQLARGKHS
jgi:signal peptidase